MPEINDTRKPYSAEEIKRIRKIMNSPASRMVCPRCGSPLSIGTPIAGGGTIRPVFQVKCKPCSCTATIMG